MIDLVRLSNYSTLECNLADLPAFLAGKVKIHLLDNEEILLCVVVKETVNIKVQLVSRLRLVVVKAYIEKGEIKHAGEQTFNPEDVSMRFGNLVGLTHHEITHRNGHHHYYLAAIGTNLTIGLEFWDGDLLNKFSQAMLYSANELQAR
jgi:hypothetical protein